MLARQSIFKQTPKLLKPRNLATPPCIFRNTKQFTTTAINMGGDQPEIITAYKELTSIKAQTQELPGKDVDMDPLAEFTKLEDWDDDGKPYLREYVGSGKLKGKKAIVTGGDSGIGRSAAQLFAREGADVTIVYLPEEEEDAQNAKKAIEADGQQCLALALDLMKADQAEAIVKKHIEKFGKLDILVNNASKQIMCTDIAEIEVRVKFPYLWHALICHSLPTSRVHSEATSSACLLSPSPPCPTSSVVPPSLTLPLSPPSRVLPV
ncbi:hypothetical protein, variant 2 [Cryptococcus amylolentus CBS 6039]|uniref:Oxidoreductase n=1 Tax=Cryptococcus amylolentus CBS 6039 TaxID=1295533 RepID=A0A1E3HMM3_9TREE|nr:hypothetical protein, variant 2 [Cryptococcus amylolentus CBS 6039]ODN77574.1 hypothetical protein, variant 2 [Cryptococcus amylolentus CBS 6039]